MGPTKIMIIRHAEKPGLYLKGIQQQPNTPNAISYNGVDPVADGDPTTSNNSLITLGWQRAGAIANLFYPSNGQFQNLDLAAPNFIVASNPSLSKSMRPYQTIVPLWLKTGLPLLSGYSDTDYMDMVNNVLALGASLQTLTVLIAWEHEDILPKKAGLDSILQEICTQTGTTPANCTGLPATPWPS